MEQLLRALFPQSALTRYTAMMMAPDGRLLFSGDLLADNDADALAQARSLARKHTVDVWDNLRFVGLVDPVKS